MANQSARDRWTADRLLELAGAYKAPCVLAAAVDLDVFTLLAETPRSAAEAAAALGADARATDILLHALAALELLEKRGERFHVPADVADLLTETGRHSILPMARHQANCLRRWVRLPWVVQSGGPAERVPSIRGAEADREAFIEAMHCHSEPLAERLVAELQPLAFRHLLDVGGATGTWTIAFLRAVPGATATLFDLPDAIPLARRRLTAEGLADRVTLAAGDFYTDDLPGGADFAWLGAIVHQNSRAQNRDLFRKVHAALVPGGRIVLRDVVMDESRTRPVAGALFAVNMLEATEAGTTYTFAELRDDLEAAGFGQVVLVRRGEFMDSLVQAEKA